MKREYTVFYRRYEADDVHMVYVYASNKYDAWDQATYEIIPKQNDGSIPYSAWVDHVEMKNGRCKQFNTFEGMPY